MALHTGPMPVSNPETVRCSSCKAPMRLAHVVPRLGGMAELRTYQCESCGRIVSRFADERPNGAAIGVLVSKGSDISG